MDFEETMVTENDSEVVDEVLPDDVVEESEESDESLESIMDDGQPAAEEPKQEPQGTSGEPGWFQKRWNKEVGKLTEQIRAEVRGEYESQFAPLRERLLEMDAQELVRSGKVKDLETAKELVRYRNGQPAAAPVAQKPAEQPRQANGQYAPKEDPEIKAKASMLRHQADKIKASMGIDVMAEYNSNEEIREKLFKGEWDFYDVADYMKSRPSQKKPPSPVRSPNGVNGQIKSAIMAMTDKQFEMLEKKVQEGARFRE